MCAGARLAHSVSKQARQCWMHGSEYVWQWRLLLKQRSAHGRVGYVDQCQAMPSLSAPATNLTCSWWRVQLFPDLSDEYVWDYLTGRTPLATRSELEPDAFLEWVKQLLYQAALVRWSVEDDATAEVAPVAATETEGFEYAPGLPKPHLRHSLSEQEAKLHDALKAGAALDLERRSIPKDTSALSDASMFQVAFPFNAGNWPWTDADRGWLETRDRRVKHRAEAEAAIVAKTEKTIELDKLEVSTRQHERLEEERLAREAAEAAERKKKKKRFF